jgi:hypothetical protein
MSLLSLAALFTSMGEYLENRNSKWQNRNIHLKTWKKKWWSFAVYVIVSFTFHHLRIRESFGIRK